MKMTVQIEGDVNALTRQTYLAAERAVTGTIREAGAQVQANWRGQVTGAGLGQRLANAIRRKNYPEGGQSIKAAAWLYVRTKTDILGSHNDGSIIRARNGVFLAIPLPAAGRNNRGGRWTPATWQFRNGVRLRFVKTPRGGLLVADDFRLTPGRGIGIRKRGKRRKDGMLTGAASVPIFALVRQVKMPKRLNLYPAAQQIASRVPSAIAAKFQAMK
jgi:hypothetical protein